MSSETGKTPLLKVENLNAWYAESQALHGMNFEVPEGELVTLIGRNGAGKSTTLRSIMGIVRKRKGSIRFKGTELIGKQTFQIAREGIAYCPEERAIFASLSVRENLGLPPVLSSGGSTDAELLEQFPNLRARQNSMGTMLSGGEQQMLAIARALARDIKVLLLDEPYEGLAPVIVDEIEKTLRIIKEQGITTILVEQNAVRALQLADRAVILDTGSIVYDGSAAEVLENESLRAEYLAI